MAYIYEVGFHITPEQTKELEIGSSIERVLGYLKTLLPGEDGYETVRAFHSVDQKPGDPVMVVIQSSWEYWDDLVKHRDSELAEEKVLLEFGEHLSKDDLAVHTFEEVA
jgi:hypothetical protein